MSQYQPNSSYFSQYNSFINSYLSSYNFIITQTVRLIVQLLRTLLKKQINPSNHILLRKLLFHLHHEQLIQHLRKQQQRKVRNGYLYQNLIIFKFTWVSCIDYGKNCSGFIGTDTFLARVTTGNKICRLKQCEDITGGTSNSNCNGVILGRSCVSNGTNCMAMTACSSQKNITSCNGGGLENSKQVTCAFTLTGTDKVNGTCKTFTACADASKDKLARTTNPSCKWTENSTGTSSANHTCDTFATETDCRPIPGFDGTTYTVFVLQNGKCTAADPGTMTDNKICYIKSAYTYSWNAATNKCESCISGSVNPNNSNGSNTSTDPGTGTNTDSAFILSAISFGILGLMA